MHSCSGKKQGQIAALAMLFLILLLFTSLHVSAKEPDPPTVSGGESVVLFDKTHQKYIVEDNAFALVNTSTSAKITTGLIACELLSDRLEETVTVTAEMLATSSGYSMKLKNGEKIKIIDLLYGAICGSYNDAAYVLAHICGNDTKGFVALMNEKALDLGAKNTAYTNPLGYPDSAAMLTTAYDTLKIALAASENQLYMEISSAVKHTVAATNLSDERMFYNRNNLISSASTAKYYNSACKGMNAGYSGEDGGWSVVTLAEDDGADYVCVLLGGKENADGSQIYAYDSVNKLVNWVKNTYNSYTVFPAGAQLGTTSVGLTGMSTGDAPYIIADDLTVYIPTVGGADVEYTIDLEDDIKAPIDANTPIGSVSVTCDGILVGKGELLIKESYEVNGIMLFIDKIGEYTTSRAFIATIICFVVLLAGYFIARKAFKYSPRAKYKRYK